MEQHNQQQLLLPQEQPQYPPQQQPQQQPQYQSQYQQQYQPQEHILTNDPHENTLGGIEGSPHMGVGGQSNGFGRADNTRHHHSQSLDQGISPRAEEMIDPAPRYATPPTPLAPSMNNNNSRPPSRLSAGGGGRDAQYQQEYRPSSRGAGAAASAAAAGGPSEQKSRDHVVIKVGMVGDAQIGKTSLMVKYVEGSWDEDYIQTLGVNFMEKTISIRNTEITFSIWDLGGQREFVNMLPLVCNDAVAILFMFDLTRKSTLNSIKEWYRQGRGFNKTAIPILVGTKYDHFVNFPREDQEEISSQARRFAKAMRAALIFSSTSHSINVQKIFKIVLSKAFDLKCTIPEIENVGEPLLLYQSC
ncbi:related to septum initiation protein sid3 [Cephalotrichum gorgonifer]|uniref:Related to septum initiation protein sid3 n=1 Tax=Cephalotrichum gorgonifer TaxID=2041049 RepID=A0AAE8SZH2_9PEZI|nr:related to septum initiation protein sid3 [Cephalotrichum gorgonifer]